MELTINDDGTVTLKATVAELLKLLTLLQELQSTP